MSSEGKPLGVRTSDLAWKAASPFAPWTIDMSGGCGEVVEMEDYVLSKS